LREWQAKELKARKEADQHHATADRLRGLLIDVLDHWEGGLDMRKVMRRVAKELDDTALGE